MSDKLKIDYISKILETGGKGVFGFLIASFVSLLLFSYSLISNTSDLVKLIVVFFMGGLLFLIVWVLTKSLRHERASDNDQRFYYKKL